MKRFVTLTAAALLAFPLLAEEPKKAEPKKTATAQPAPEAPPPAIADSPLVAAAKRANRARRKPGVVITNETLAKEGGHITTTTNQGSINLAPPPAPAEPTPEMRAADQAARVKLDAARAAEKQKVVEAAKQRETERTARMVEDDIYAEEIPPTEEERKQGEVPQDPNAPRPSQNTSRPQESKPQR